MLRRLKRTVKMSCPPGLRRMIQPLSFEVICTGLPKTGTTSLARMFEGARADHEPNAVEVLQRLHAAQRSSTGYAELKRYYEKDHPRITWLELESAWHRSLFPELLRTSAPRARYVVTIRDPISWADSVINNTIIHYPITLPDRYERRDTGLYLKIMFGPEPYHYENEEQELREHGVAPLGSMLAFWTTQYENLLKVLADSNSLLVRTEDISRRADEIYDFVGWQPPSASSDRPPTHVRKTSERFGILARLPREFVDRRLEQCRPLLDQHFPDYAPAEIIERIRA